MGSALRPLLFSDKFSDATFIAKCGTQIPVHKSIVCTQSTVIDTMLSSRWKAKGDCSLSFNFDLDTLLSLLFYLYVGKLSPDADKPCVFTYNKPTATTSESGSIDGAHNDTLECTIHDLDGHDDVHGSDKKKIAMRQPSDKPTSLTTQPSSANKLVASRTTDIMTTYVQLVQDKWLAMLKLYEAASYFMIPELQNTITSSMKSRLQDRSTITDDLCQAADFMYSRLDMDNSMVNEVENYVLDHLCESVTGSLANVLETHHGNSWRIIKKLLTKVRTRHY